MKLIEILSEAGFAPPTPQSGQQPTVKEFITQLRTILSNEISDQIQKNSQLSGDKKAAYVQKGYVNGLSHAITLLDGYMRNRSFDNVQKKTFGTK